MGNILCLNTCDDEEISEESDSELFNEELTIVDQYTDAVSISPEFILFSTNT